MLHELVLPHNHVSILDSRWLVRLEGLFNILLAVAHGFANLFCHLLVQFLLFLRRNVRGNVAGSNGFVGVDACVVKFLDGRVKVGGEVLEEPRVLANFVDGCALHWVDNEHLLDQASRAGAHPRGNHIASPCDFGE